MKFHMPVVVGDEVSVYADLSAVGRTSMTIEVEAWRRARHSNDSCKVTQARFIFRSGRRRSQTAARAARIN